MMLTQTPTAFLTARLSGGTSARKETARGKTIRNITAPIGPSSLTMVDHHIGGRADHQLKAYHACAEAPCLRSMISMRLCAPGCFVEGPSVTITRSPVTPCLSSH